MKYLLLVLLFVPLITGQSAVRSWRSIDEAVNPVVKAASEATEDSVSLTTTQQQTDTFFNGLQQGLENFQNQFGNSWKQVTEVVSKAGGQVSTAFNISIPYFIVFGLLAAVFYASFAIVSTAVSTKRDEGLLDYMHPKGTYAMVSG